MEQLGDIVRVAAIIGNNQSEAPGAAATERIVMLGVAIPDVVMAAVIKADPAPDVPAQKISWAVIRGIECTGKVIDLISTVPIRDYPKSDRLWSGYQKWDRANGSDNQLLPFINVLGFKQLTRFFGCVAVLLRWSIANRRHKRHVLVYSLISAHLCAVWCVRLLFSIKTTVLITDLPGLATGQESWWRRWLRPIDGSIIHHTVQTADGLMVLTQAIAEDYAPNVPAMVMEGMVSLQSEELAKTVPESSGRPKEFIVLYTGALGRKYGIALLLDAFAELPGEGFRLWLFGSGDMAEDIRRRAKEDPRVYFAGRVAPEEAFRKCQQATVLINPRPTNEPFTRYSFPSKVLEYMAAGRPVITTRLSAIPPEYNPYLIWLDRETPEGLATLLRQLGEEPRKRLDELGGRGRDFVLQEKNYRRQGRRIVEFIEHINSLSNRKR